MSRPPSVRSLPSRSEINNMVDRIARQYDLDRDLVHAIIKAESAYDPRAFSPAGAVGLMQVMPETASDYGVESAKRLFDPETNLHTGMRHLKRLLKKYASIGSAVMAYNAGEGALERNKGQVPYTETQHYTKQVLNDYLARKGLAFSSDQARNVIGVTLDTARTSNGGRPQEAESGRETNSLAADTRWQPMVERSRFDKLTTSQFRRSPSQLSSGLIFQAAPRRPSLRVKSPSYAISQTRLAFSTSP